MNSLLKIFSVFCLLGILTGCDPIKGTLTVSSPFKAIANNFNKCDGDPDVNCDPDDHKFTVLPGNYDVTFEVTSKKNVNLEMVIRGHKATIEMAIPKGKELPENGGIILSSKESGQPFNLIAEVKTTIHDSEKRAEVQSCTIQWQETVCRQVGYPPRTECWTQTHTRYGQREVHYFFRTAVKEIVANFSMPAKPDEKSAQFKGSRKDSETIYTYDSGCR